MELFVNTRKKAAPQCTWMKHKFVDDKHRSVEVMVGFMFACSCFEGVKNNYYKCLWREVAI
jgi:hypothetical protein